MAESVRSKLSDAIDLADGVGGGSQRDGVVSCDPRGPPAVVVVVVARCALRGVPDALSAV